ncbi:hypothetical protein BV25DRAFT_504225 [Artomyces pyxidatus]|uniref:Uncharacterized protein n=1 Tax=Artomyces pyxidatus TaxID=48021 RepID=A0ACB8THT2_9AGAM|nr:hypothetical protein BV25DRAFT_504225 [Artomyces pyxidatus]
MRAAKTRPLGRCRTFKSRVLSARANVSLSSEVVRAGDPGHPVVLPLRLFFCASGPRPRQYARTCLDGSTARRSSETATPRRGAGCGRGHAVHGRAITRGA